MAGTTELEPATSDVTGIRLRGDRPPNELDPQYLERLGLIHGNFSIADHEEWILNRDDILERVSFDNDQVRLVSHLEHADRFLQPQHPGIDHRCGLNRLERREAHLDEVRHLQ